MLAGLEGAWTRGRVRGRLRPAGWGAALGYPALVLDPEGELVEGFVFTSDELAGQWDALDAFEGPEYRREVALVETEDAGPVRAYVYVLRSG